ncbi:hypothetical protein GOP47_0015261 [Adiantum capillus-veneris]|uniref:Uncharacterized protein n=1 Tax=Adiantum capillus-veneris TaxID=13818 RepID=A0A9D4UJF9_ADICA|nr:hypothetical protein GOP47_0015261 [Adiantum capillus-veneris]
MVEMSQPSSIQEHARNSQKEKETFVDTIIEEDVGSMPGRLSHLFILWSLHYKTYLVLLTHGAWP